ncbi:MAG: cytochrome P450 [Solirubrobacteraceae bacterium]|nr:MAG: cytochrome P450 [Solirubrobacterales bacterium]
MTLVSELDLPVLEDMDPALRGDRFHGAMRGLREQGWLAKSTYGYVALDREAVEFFLRSRATTFPGLLMADLLEVPAGPLREQIERNIINVNGGDHRRLRNLVNPALSPRAVERYRPAMRDYLEELLAPLLASGRCEFVEAVAKPYPSLVIAAVMGAAREDAPRLYDWSNWIQRQFDAPSMLEQRERIEQAVAEFYEYADELLARRRRDPGDDLISKLLAAELEGDRLSEVECKNLVLNVLVGGVDTTQSQLSHAIRLFAAHPDQWELLAERPELTGAAVEEVLRFEPITPFTARITLEDVEYRGVTFPQNTVVLVSAFNANREPGAANALERFDISAEREAATPLTFGAGMHYCLGANLARAELQEALTLLPRRLPGLALDGEPRLDSINGIYGVLELPISFQPAP